MLQALPKAIIFDWDNTLVDSWEPIAEAINLTRAHFGLPVWDMPQIMANCTRAAKDSFPEWFGDRWQEAYNFYYEGFDTIRKSRPIKLKPGAKKLLEWLAGQGIPALIVSNKRSDYLLNEVERLRWQHLLAGVTGATDVKHAKPHRDHADHALQLIDMAAGPDIWFVGDSESDMLCAKNTHCFAVLLGDMAAAKGQLVDLNLHDCAELLIYLSTTQAN